MSTTPAGWYPDTQTPGQQRYWDGSQWTEHTAPGAGQAQPGTIALAVANPYDKHYDLSQVSEEQRQAWMQHELTEFPTWALIVLSIITLGIFGLIYMGLKHGKLPKVKSNDPGAGKAIGFWFIPFFSLYWIFPLWVGLSDRINFQYRLRGAQPPVSRDFAMWTNIVYLSGILLGVTYVVGIIMWLVLIGQQQAAVNRLVQGKVQAVPLTTPAGGYAQTYPAQQAPAEQAPAQPQAPTQAAQSQQGFEEPPPPAPPPAYSAGTGLLVALNPGHHRAQLAADLLDLVRGGLVAQALEVLAAGAVLGDPLLRELARLDVVEDLPHRLADLGPDHARAAGHIAVLGGVRDRVAHPRDSLLVHQVDDQLQLVQALEVGEARVVARPRPGSRSPRGPAPWRRRTAPTARRTGRSRTRP